MYPSIPVINTRIPNVLCKKDRIKDQRELRRTGAYIKSSDEVPVLD
jgi:hypothetical protein